MNREPGNYAFIRGGEDRRAGVERTGNIYLGTDNARVYGPVKASRLVEEWYAGWDEAGGEGGSRA